MRFRIAIQSIKEGKYKHEHNVMLEAESLEEIIRKTRECLKEEIQKREELLIQWLSERQKDMYEKIISETDKDLIDWKAKGKDISKEEYIKNEIEAELNG